MPKLTLRFFLAVLTFILGVAATTVILFDDKTGLRKQDAPPTVQEGREVSLSIPSAGWEPIYFRFINERASKANLPSLRATALRGDDFEVRVWIGFGEAGVDGFILRRSADRWSATHLPIMSEGPLPPDSQKTLSAPKSGWETAWQKLVSAGILTLPDASEVRCNAGIVDGVGYVVEININKTYRTYMYDNPQQVGCDEAKRLLAIDEIITEEFGLRDFRTGK